MNKKIEWLPLIDWRKAPFEATHRGRNGCWYRIHGEHVDLLSHDGVIYNRESLSSYIDWRDWEARPGVAPWSGEGRPPVGTVCEAQIPSSKYSWEVVTVIWHHPEHEGSAAVTHGEGKLLGWSGSFRPIRTPEQIAAAEARDDAISRMVGFVKDHPSKYPGVPHLTQLKIQEDACIDLYDAGCRMAVSQ